MQTSLKSKPRTYPLFDLFSVRIEFGSGRAGSGPRLTIKTPFGTLTLNGSKVD